MCPSVGYNLFLPAFLAAAHLFLAEAAIFILATLLIFRLFFGVDLGAASEAPKSLLSCFSSDSIFDLSMAALSKVLTDRLVIEFIGINNKRRT